MKWFAQAYAGLVLFVLAASSAAGASAQDPQQEKPQSKVIFIEKNGVYCPVVGVHKGDPIIGTQEGPTGPIETDYNYIIKEGPFPSKGHVAILKIGFQPPPPFLNTSPSGNVVFVAEEDHETLFMVTYLVHKESEEVGYFWLNDIGPVKADDIQKVSALLDGVRADSWGSWLGYELEYQFYEAGHPLETHEPLDS